MDVIVGDSRGFTIVELLVALALLGAVMAVLTQSITFGRTFLERSTSTLDRMDELSVLTTVLRGPLNQIVGGQAGGAVSGNRYLLNIRTLGDRAPALDPPLILTLQPSADGTGAVASWQSEKRTSPAVTRPLLKPTSRIRFSYYAPDLGWTDAWSEKRAPSAIRVTVEQSGAASQIELDFQLRVVGPECGIAATVSCGGAT
jgi:prepilin-type N-terminal cleavage/methylation domain-containing protein